jgi:hypothetical protein
MIPSHHTRIPATLEIRPSWAMRALRRSSFHWANAMPSPPMLAPTTKIPISHIEGIRFSTFNLPATPPVESGFATTAEMRSNRNSGPVGRPTR